MAKHIEKCLNDFIRHVNTLLAEDDPAGNGFHREFRVLRESQIENKRNELFPTDEGQKDENIKKNRYKDILPRDDRRVVLSTIEGEAGSSYINATFIKGVDGENGYIAAQGPMLNTVNDFWRMLWEHKTEVIFMACRLIECGKQKCEKYWPDVGKTELFGNIAVRTDSEETIQVDFVMRKLTATKDGVSHSIIQFHFMGWPDHGTPASPKTLKDMIEYVRSYRQKKNIPLVIHCSAGCGRTGTICAVDYAWTLLDLGQVNNGFSIFDIIKSLRDQRMSMVQTPDQYEYTHMVIKSLCEEWLQEFAKHDYENILNREENYVNMDIDHDDVGFSSTGLWSSFENIGTLRNSQTLSKTSKSEYSTLSTAECCKHQLYAQDLTNLISVEFEINESLAPSEGEAKSTPNRKAIPIDLDAPAVPARLYSTDDWRQRPQPVRGPRPMPAEWNLQLKFRQDTYL
ncbi:tyrosine-protein phosphatase non-receptor type 12-like isoform X3 [Pomacea canaliculata]|uniref:tyrosine-protein phosphatase non-receptor type 12-like isoform X3 n=1 Tax=Pomacea canaliculata TaxID=400727 RepID=UPI000D72D42E|nr:tyrosine-protein phosphatase non-receptor type 12-like isoform X3 [Pomacea canaliculata]